MELRQRIAQLEGILGQTEETEVGEDALPVTDGDCDAGATDAATQAAFQCYVGRLRSRRLDAYLIEICIQTSSTCPF